MITRHHSTSAHHKAIFVSLVNPVAFELIVVWCRILARSHRHNHPLTSVMTVAVAMTLKKLYGRYLPAHSPSRSLLHPHPRPHLALALGRPRHCSRPRPLPLPLALSLSLAFALTLTLTHPNSSQALTLSVTLAWPYSLTLTLTLTVLTSTLAPTPP